MRMLRVSSSQIGHAYWQAIAVRLSSVQRPREARGSPFPHLLRAHAGEDGGERSDPRAAADRHIVGDGKPRIPILQPLSR